MRILEKTIEDRLRKAADRESLMRRVRVLISEKMAAIDAQKFYLGTPMCYTYSEKAKTEKLISILHYQIQKLVLYYNIISNENSL